MDGYQIFTDATSDLAPELTAGLPSVEMIPMNVEIGGTEYSYGSPEGITAKEFYRLQRAYDRTEQNDQLETRINRYRTFWQMAGESE